MPPAAFSDDEGSDAGVAQSSAKKPSRVKNPAKYEEVPEDDDAISTDERNGAAEGDEEEEDDEEDLDEEVYEPWERLGAETEMADTDTSYVVEKIMSHMIERVRNGLRGRPSWATL